MGSLSGAGRLFHNIDPLNLSFSKCWLHRRHMQTVTVLRTMTINRSI